MIVRSLIPRILLAICIISGACSPSKSIDKELEAAQQKVPGITFAQLTEGRKMYIRTCAGCHALKDPSKYTPVKWQPILAKMFVKAKVSESARVALITDYVMAKSK